MTQFTHLQKSVVIKLQVINPLTPGPHILFLPLNTTTENRQLKQSSGPRETRTRINTHYLRTDLYLAAIYGRRL